jgi:uncharacterized membrane protein YfcA
MLIRYLPMNNRRRLAAWLTLAAFVAAVGLVFAGALFPPVGPLVPPTRVVATTRTGNTVSMTVEAHHQPRTVNWPVAVPLCALGIAGILMLVLPAKERPGR